MCKLPRVIAQRVWRIGKLTLWQEAERFFVRCQNRTYNHTHELQPEQMERWKKLVTTGR